MPRFIAKTTLWRITLFSSSDLALLSRALRWRLDVRVAKKKNNNSLGSITPVIQAIGMRTLIPIIEYVHDNERVSATFSHFVNGYDSTPLINFLLDRYILSIAYKGFIQISTRQRKVVSTSQRCSSSRCHFCCLFWQFVSRSRNISWRRLSTLPKAMNAQLTRGTSSTTFITRA